MRKNKLLDTSCLDSLREKEARQNPLYNPKSKKWIVNICQGFEVSVIRQNNRHGFISLGWGNWNEKVIIGDLQECETKKQRQFMTSKYLKIAKEICVAMNKLDKE